MKYGNLGRRAVTAFFIVALMILPIVYHPIAASILFYGIMIIGSIELCKLMGLNTMRTIGVLFISSVIYIGGIIYIYGVWENPLGLILFFLSLLFFTAATIVILQPGPSFFLDALTGSAMFIASPLILINYLVVFDDQNSTFYLLQFLLFVWAHDTAAYLIGRKFGKNKLSVKISPNKTWEGTIGGAVVVLIAAVISSQIWGEPGWFYGLGAVIILGCNMGDLMESSIKRNRMVKDTSSILPGHGGILDRFDSFIYNIPFVVLYHYITIVGS